MWSSQETNPAYSTALVAYTGHTEVWLLWSDNAYNIQYNIVYLTCSKKLTCSQLVHHTNKKIKAKKTKNKSRTMISPVQYQINTKNFKTLTIIIIIIITTTMFMVLSSWQRHCESSPSSSDECRMAPSGRRPKTKPDDLGCKSACTGCQKLHPPSPFIIITQPESWYSFYRPTEGRRLSRPSWLFTYHRRSPIRVITGSDVAQLRWSRPTRYH